MIETHRMDRPSSLCSFLGLLEIVEDTKELLFWKALKRDTEEDSRMSTVVLAEL